jgi:hypothetical protein
MSKVYQVTLVENGLTLQSGVIIADDDADANEKAKQWATSVGYSPDSWLHVMAEGRGVASFRPGSF